MAGESTRERARRPRVSGCSHSPRRGDREARRVPKIAGVAPFDSFHGCIMRMLPSQKEEQQARASLERRVKELEQQVKDAQASRLVEVEAAHGQASELFSRLEAAEKVHACSHHVNTQLSMVHCSKAFEELWKDASVVLAQVPTPFHHCDLHCAATATRYAAGAQILPGGSLGSWLRRCRRRHLAAGQPSNCNKCRC